MPSESQIPIASEAASKRFATRLGLFYGTTFGTMGTHAPFFTLWLKSVGIDASWIGIISAVPAVTRFTVLPFVTGLAGRRYPLRTLLTVTAAATALGFAVIGTQYWPLAILFAYAATCCLWTPMVPLTDAYALGGVVRYGLSYGPLRLWGSAAFIVGVLICGLLLDLVATRHLIWVIASVAALGAVASLGLQPLDRPKPAAAATHGASALLRDPGFLAIIVAAGLIQGSHAALYAFASISWQAAGLGGLTIAGLWVLGVLAEIVVFALSPRFTLAPALLVVIAALSAFAALADRGAGAFARGAQCGPARAWADIWTDAGRHHGTAGAPCARPSDGARAGLSRGLRRHRHQHGVGRVGRDLCRLRPARLLSDGGDGVDCRDRDVAGAAPADSDKN